MHTYAFKSWGATPYLAITSPTARAGKTRLFEVLEAVVAGPWRVVDATPATMFRYVDAFEPTMLLDEVDSAEISNHLRAILNSGYRAGATVPRMEKGEIVEFSTYCPKAFAGIGDALPTTLADRSIEIKVERRAPHEHVEPWKRNRAWDEAEAMRPDLERVAAEIREEAPGIDLGPSEAHNDRAVETWEPLLVIANLAGEEWPERAAAAAKKLLESKGEPDPGVRLLADIRFIAAIAAWKGGPLPTRFLVKQLRRLREGRSCKRRSLTVPSAGSSCPCTSGASVFTRRSSGTAARMARRASPGLCYEELAPRFERYLPVK